MGRSDHRKRRGCFVYAGATLLVVSTLVPIVAHSRTELPPVDIEWHHGSLYDLSRNPYGIRDELRKELRHGGNGILQTTGDTTYHAVLGHSCFAGEGAGEFYGILAFAIAAVAAFHLRLSRLIWIPSAAAGIWIVFALWRFISCMSTVPLPDPSPFSWPLDQPVEGPIVAPWGWVAAVAGAIVLCVESFVRERRRGKTPEQLRRVFK